MLGPGSPVVKNTFIEIPDDLETTGTWRRQLSEPVEILRRDSEEPDTKGIAPELFLSDSDDSTALSHSTDPVLRANSDVSVVHRIPHGNSFEELEASRNLPVRHGSNVVDVVKSPEGKSAQSNRRNLNRLKDNDITKVPPPWSDITTVMMRNLPNRYTQQKLLDELREAGFLPHRHFNFFYLPMDHNNAANLGYSFINFTETSYANAFALAFQGKRMHRFKSNKTVVVMAASIQGYDKNYAYYSSTRIVLADDPQYRPLFFKHAGQSGPAGKGSSQPKLAQSKSSSKGDSNRTRWSKELPTRENVPALWTSGSVEPTWSCEASDAPSTWSTHAASAELSSLSSADTGPTIVCVYCGSDCGSGHRFCAGCGAVIGQAPVMDQQWGSPITTAVQAPMPAMMPPAYGDMSTRESHQMAPGMQHFSDVWSQTCLPNTSYYAWGQQQERCGPDMAQMGEDVCGMTGHNDLRVGGSWVPQEAPYVF